MFFSSHDLQLLLVVLGFGLVASFGFAYAVSRPITSDLRQMASTAQSVAGGDFAATTDVARADEVGELAEAIDAMAADLRHAERVRLDADEARREFLTAVGHDLRSPLGSLQAAVEALQDGVAPDPERYLSSMGRDIAALHRLVDDVFLLARLEAGAVEFDYQPVDVTEIADEAIEVLQPTAHRLGVTVELEAAGSITTDTAPDALGRVMRNLIDNAIQDVHIVLTHFSKVVVFAEFNLKLNLLWVSIRPVQGIRFEIATAIQEQVPEAKLVSHI